MKKESRHEIKPFPQQSIDLMFWQYVQGVKDAVTKVSATNPEQQIKTINFFIYEKLENIKRMHPGRRPAFDLKAERVGDKIEIKKTMLP